MNGLTRTVLGPKRRLVEGDGGALPVNVADVLRLARKNLCRWEATGRRLPRLDQVEAERVLWQAVGAGLVVVEEKKDRRGDWQPKSWWLTAKGEALLPKGPSGPNVANYLATADNPAHPVLAAIRAWLTRGAGSSGATRIVLAIGEELRVGRIPRERIVSMRAKGSSKALRLAGISEGLRNEVEEAVGYRLEEILRAGDHPAFVAGPITFRVGGIVIDSKGLPPFMAMARETLEGMEYLRIEGDRLLTIENWTPFVNEARAGLPANTIALWVKGLPGDLECEMIRRLVAAGIRVIDHWGDLDLGGLRVLRYLQSTAGVPVSTFRMDPGLLDEMPLLELKPIDREQLEKWIADKEAPGRELAAAILRKGGKAEQEGWYIRSDG